MALTAAPLRAGTKRMLAARHVTNVVEHHT